MSKKKNPRFYIASPWRIVIQHDSYAEVMHHPLEDSRSQEEYLSTYLQVIEDLHRVIPFTPRGSQFVDSFVEDNIYHGGYLIINTTLWSRHIEQNRMNEAWMQNARFIWRGAKMRDDYQTHLEQGGQTPWNIFKREYLARFTRSDTQAATSSEAVEIEDDPINDTLDETDVFSDSD